MAKKAQKGKPAKKAAVPAKKAAPKKAAKPAKNIVKKAAPKKAAVPAKKAVVKKLVKKVIAKKVIAKKAVKKAAAKKVVAKKVVKPAKKVTAKKITLKKIVKPVNKVVAKKVIKKVVPKKAEIKSIKKAAAKPIAKPAVKEEVKAETKNAVVAKPLIAAKAIPVVKKAEPVFKKKQDNNFDLDDENRDEESLVVEYKTPSIHRPMGPVPKPHVNTDNRTRYTDAELKEFKELILKKLAEAQKDYELLKSTLSHKDDHGTDDTSPTFKLLEDGSDVLSKEETSHLAGRQEKFIQNLQNALIRIENKTYGICRVTGKLISKERLRSVPHATLVIEAKLGQNT